MRPFLIILAAAAVSWAHNDPPPQQGSGPGSGQGSGGMGTQVQDPSGQRDTRFREHLDEIMHHQREGSGFGPDQLQDIYSQLQNIRPEERRNQYMDAVNTWYDKVSQASALMKTDPMKAMELMAQARDARHTMWDIGGPTQGLGRAFFGSSMSDNIPFGHGGGGFPFGGAGDGRGRGGMGEAQEWGRQFPHDPIIQNGVGRVLSAGGDLQGAKEAFQNATRAEPSNKNYWNNLAQSQLALNDYSGAVESGLRTLAIDPKDSRANALVRMYKDRAAPAEAIRADAGAAAQGGAAAAPGAYRPASEPAAIRQFRGRDPEPVSRASVDSARLAVEAEHLLGIKDPVRAEAAARRAVEAAPDNFRARFALLQSLIAQRKYQEALEASEVAVRAFPANPTMRAMNVRVLNLMGRYQDALASAELGLAANPGNAEILWGEATAFGGLGRYGEARAALRQAGEDARFAESVRKAMAVPDDQLLAFLTGDPSLLPASRLKVPSAPYRPRWPIVVGGVLAGLLLGLWSLSGSGSSWLDTLKRSLARAGSASPAVQAMPVGAPPAPDGLAASGIRIERKIGAGGMGVVYKGTDVSLERPVAVKKMREEIRSDARERERFIREAKTVAGLRHPNIVEIYSIVEDGSDVYLVFEFVTGKTVHELVAEHGALPFPYALGVVRGVAAALDYAHRRGVIHRDLKPANIMVEEDGLVKVMDFGVARQAKDSLARMSMTNTVVGTPPYMAPEQEQGIVRKESDVYALAVCLYEMVTGQLPFQGVGAGMLMAKLNRSFVPPSRVRQGLPPGLDEVMARVFDPDPEKRLRTAAELVRALEALPVA